MVILELIGNDPLKMGFIMGKDASGKIEVILRVKLVNDIG